jgi:hypothetical protein
MSKNLNERRSTIEAVYAIPLEELAMHVIDPVDDCSLLLEYLHNSPSIVEAVLKSIIKRILCFQKSCVRVRELKFAYNDSDNLSHGISYFNVKLRGTKPELKKVAGEDKIFMYDRTSE